MGITSLYKPIRHSELVDLTGDPILTGGGNFAADVLANRPAPGKPVGEDRFFYAEDEDKLYRDTGAAWQEIVSRASAVGEVLHLGAGQLEATRNSPTRAAYQTIYMAWFLDAVNDEGICTWFVTPSGWKTINLDMWWVNPGTGAGDIRFIGTIGSFAIGEAVVATGTAVQTATAAAQHVLVSTRLATDLVVTPGEIQAVGVERRGFSEVADTLGNDIAILALVASRSS